MFLWKRKRRREVWVKPSRSDDVCDMLCLTAIAAAVQKWQELKEQGKIEEPPEEEDIYASVRIGQVKMEGRERGGGVKERDI